MMQSICLNDEPEADQDWHVVEHGYGGPRTPSTTSDGHDTETDTRTQQYDTSDAGSDDEYGGSVQGAPKRKKGGYDSRIEQILYENPDLPILIVDAGKSLESGGKYIVYTIRTGVWELKSKRRLVLMLNRIWKSEEDIRNLRPFGMRSHVYIQPLSCHRSPRSILWRTTLRIQPKRSKTSK